jgi:hypothetical protein
MTTFREIALKEAKRPKTSLTGKYYIQKVQDMINWCEKQKEWVGTKVEDEGSVFYIEYNSPKAALNKVRSIRKQFDDIIEEHGNDNGILTIYLDKKEVLLRKSQEEKKQDSGYIVYHNSYSAAISEIEKFANKNGYSLDDESDSENKGAQMFDIVGTGPSKPKEGKTNSFHFTLYKGSKQQTKMLHAQIYNRGSSSNEFELNLYIN